ncbi:DNA polymerase IV [Hirschia litorea]|uniref:DNA polymerase IV n=1 Tax=Hirschia litorea TaxID=1199156 RepID=A0ABW2IIB0_9PROT
MADHAIRKIIHIDMDAFFASVEQRDNADLRGKPVAVGGSAARGVVAAASYEAREFGVRSAMASVVAKRKCPDLIFVPPRFDVYREVSHQIRKIFEEHTDLIEPLSLDEAYLDVTQNKQNIESATQIALRIRERIWEDTQLTASAGVSYNKFIAKLASDQNKPNGQCVITPQHGPDFVMSLPVRRFHGVGPVTAAKMESLNVFTGADLRDMSLDLLKAHFGSSADYLYGAVRGIDERPVRVDRVRKSVGVERTFNDDLHDMAAVETAMERIIPMLWERIERANATGYTLTLKVKFSDFKQITRSHTLTHAVSDIDTVYDTKDLLLKMIPSPLKPIRLLGLTLSGLGDGQMEQEGNQLSFPF